MRLYYALKKESIILFRNRSALLSLFLMPAIFILIMSLAQKDIYNEYKNADIKYLIVNQDKGDKSLHFIEALKSYSQLFFKIEDNLSVAKKAILDGEYMFVLHISKGFSGNLYRLKSKNIINIYISPATKAPFRLYFQSKMIEVVMQMKMKKMLDALTMYNDQIDTPKPEEIIATHYLYKKNKHAKIPTSTQQNVPAWIVFSMFFVIIPISTLFIVERDDGTLDRLNAIHSPKRVFILSKIIPYMVVNQMQLYSMIAVGLFLVPLFGGDRLDMDIDFAGLFVISVAISFAAIGFALFLAVFMKTIEQASVMGALSAVIMGAVGGIMIPKLVMPPLMQDMTVLSPMAWALDGMLDIFVNKLGTKDILYEASVLVIFGIITLVAATLHYKRI